MYSWETYIIKGWCLDGCQDFVDKSVPIWEVKKMKRKKDGKKKMKLVSISFNPKFFMKHKFVQVQHLHIHYT